MKVFRALTDILWFIEVGLLVLLIVFRERRRRAARARWGKE
jgi:hypothetical protein